MKEEIDKSTVVIKVCYTALSVINRSSQKINRCIEVSRISY